MSKVLKEVLRRGLDKLKKPVIIFNKTKTKRGCGYEGFNSS